MLSGEFRHGKLDGLAAGDWNNHYHRAINMITHTSNDYVYVGVGREVIQPRIH